jgi:ureidoacrylate peracid hydrolase
MSEDAVLTLEERIAPATTALILVDVQNDFCHDDSPLAAMNDMAAAQAMVPRLRTLIDAARQAGTLVVWIQMVNNEHVFSPVQRDQRLRTRPGTGMVCLEASWGTDFYEVAPAPGEPIVVKHRYSAFIDTDLDLILRSRGIKSLIMTGVATNVCVESTARDGYMRDYHIVFVDDCSACYDPAKHAATLRNITDHFGVVVQSPEIMATWQASAVPAWAGAAAG